MHLRSRHKKLIMQSIIQLEHVYKRYPVGDGEFEALADINLSFGAGEFAGFVGPSGSGKTTLLNIIGSLDKPTEGKALVLGQDIGSLTNKESAHLRNKDIGFIFQVFNLLPVYTVFENVEFALLLQGVPVAARKKRVMEALEWTGITRLKDTKPDKLSGGEGQRVAIARALVKRPAILLADEPTANLDAKNAHLVLQTMKKLNEELNTTFLFSTHDEKVMQYLERTIHLLDGRIDEDEIRSDSQ